ncbi:nucleotidyltransferase family protein, partial [Streptococcus thermophilus]
TIADVYSEKSEEMEAFVESLPSDLSYPQKTQKMWEKFAGVDFTGNTPNHILGLAYAKACAGKGITLNPIQRQGAGYHSLDKEVSFASATSLRLHKEDSDFVDKFM